MKCFRSEIRSTTYCGEPLPRYHALGIEVEALRNEKDVELPEAMQQVMAMQAEASREKRARIIKAESRKLGSASKKS